jgi:hypothetical protein
MLGLLKIPIMLLFLVLAGIFPQCRGSLLCSDWITSVMGWSFNVTHCAHELNSRSTEKVNLSREMLLEAILSED